MLSLKHKTFKTSDRLCDAVNRHPYWQIVQIVSKDGYLDLFYKTEEELPEGSLDQIEDA